MHLHLNGIAITLVLTFCCHACLPAEDYRTITNSDGKTIEAIITDYDATRGVSLKTKSGQIFKDVPVVRFSTDDQNYFKTWAEKREAERSDATLTPESKIKVLVSASGSKGLNKKGDPDNLEVEHEPGVSFVNEEKETTFKKVSGTLVLLGQSVIEKNEYHILFREDFDIDLPPGENVEWEGQPFTNVYDSITGNGSAFGAPYESYLLVLRNKEGVICISKTNSPKLLEYTEAILKADMRQGHSRDFKTSGQKSTF